MRELVSMNPKTWEIRLFNLASISKFHTWTHACLALVLDHLSTLPPAAYTQELPGFGFPDLRAQVVHVFNCESFWIHTLRSASFRGRDPASCPSISDARELQHQVMQQTIAYLSRLTEEELNTGSELNFDGGDIAVRTPALVLHHVFTHAFHHKGQIVAMCRVLGHPAPDTDLNQFE
jgi:uncharacterized damage-inducible protein DinB